MTVSANCIIANCEDLQPCPTNNRDIAKLSDLAGGKRTLTSPRSKVKMCCMFWRYPTPHQVEGLNKQLLPACYVTKSPSA